MVSLSEDRRRYLWLLLSDQFLDTETRTSLPRCASELLAAGLTPEEAFDLWRFEVTPAVYSNLWSVAGEWAGFDAQWLYAAIERGRGSVLHRPGLLGSLVYRLRASFAHANWVCLEGCLRLLQATPEGEREQLCSDLQALAAHYFAFCEKPLPREDKPRLERVFREHFLALFSPLVRRDGEHESRPLCAARVESALRA